VHIRPRMNRCWSLQHVCVCCSCTGCRSREIAVSERLFQDGFVLFKGLTKYRAGVVVTTVSGEQGVSFLDFEVNTAPTGGSCAITPGTGVSVQSFFIVTCTDWTDSDGILKYQFFSKSTLTSKSESMLMISRLGCCLHIATNLLVFIFL